MTSPAIVHATALERPKFIHIWHSLQRVHTMRLPFDDVEVGASVRLNELKGRAPSERRYMVGRVTAWQPETKTATVVITTRASGPGAVAMKAPIGHLITGRDGPNVGPTVYECGDCGALSVTSENVSCSLCQRLARLQVDVERALRLANDALRYAR